MCTLAYVDKSVYNASMSKIKIKAKLSARERILTTAHDLFYQDGIRATGIDRIIAESGVTKVTLYRHFPSKNELIKAYLEYRHEQLMAHLSAALQQHKDAGDSARVAIMSVLRAWFESEGFRGCAFINAVVELQGVLPEVAEISKRHKQEVERLIAGLLPKSKARDANALSIAVAMDGAIIRAQMEGEAGAAMAGLERVLVALVGE